MWIPVANVSLQGQSSVEDEDLASFGDLPTEENAQALLHHMEGGFERILYFVFDYCSIFH